MSEKHLVVGLGNPGRPYQHNRHNVGFHVVDRLAERHGLTFSRQQNGALVASGSIGNCPVILAKPQKFMNLSGGPVAALVKFYRIPPQRLLVIYDDLDLPLAVIRLRPAGGSGGHKGVQHIIERLGRQDFARLRVGIGRPPGRMDPADYVLQDFSAEQLPLIEEAWERAADAVEVWLSEGIEQAMSRFNGLSPER